MYQTKLKEIVDAFAPADGRSTEAENRPAAISELQAQIARFAAFAADESEAYNHIKAEDKEKVAAESKKAEEWLAGMSAKLEGLAMTDEPPVKVAELQAKTTSLIGARAARPASTVSFEHSPSMIARPSVSDTLRMPHMAALPGWPHARS